MLKGYNLATSSDNKNGTRHMLIQLNVGQLAMAVRINAATIIMLVVIEYICMGCCVH